MEQDIVNKLMELGGNNAVVLVAVYMLHTFKVEFTAFRSQIAEKMVSIESRIKTMERNKDGK